MSEVAFTIRAPIELHERLKIIAHVHNSSLNTLVVSALYEKYVNDPRIEAIRKLVEEVRDEGLSEISTGNGTSRKDE